MTLEKLQKELVKLEESLWLMIETDNNINPDNPLYKASNLITEAYTIIQEEKGD